MPQLFECNNCNNTTIDPASAESLCKHCGVGEVTESCCTECRRAGQLCLKCTVDIHEDHQSEISGPNLVGNSLSFCVMAVLRGEVDENDIRLIRCSFRAPPDEDHFRETLAFYCDVYWKRDPELAERVALRLYRENRLQFTGGHFLPSDGVWGEIDLRPLSAGMIDFSP